MFVTSDIYDLARVARRRGFEWRENLLCGVAVHCRDWPGYSKGASFLLEAADRCGCSNELKWAGHGVPTGQPMQSIPLSSFERLAREDGTEPTAPTWLLLRGERDTFGTESRHIVFGGEAFSSVHVVQASNGPLAVVGYPRRPGFAYFLFPYQNTPDEQARNLLKLAVDILGADYGYYFVRDDLCCASGYAMGISTPLDWSLPNGAEADETSGWFKFCTSSEFGAAEGALLRDLYQVNLLSERHATVPIEGLGSFIDWITAEPARGRLLDVGQGRMLWSLSDAQLFNVRPLLHRAGLLKSCSDRVYRDLEPGFLTLPL